MLGRLFRKLTHSYRLQSAEWDLKYFRSAVEHATAELARAQRRLNLIEQERNEIRYPLPRLVRRRNRIVL